MHFLPSNQTNHNIANGGQSKLLRDLNAACEPLAPFSSQTGSESFSQRLSVQPKLMPEEAKTAIFTLAN